MQLAYSEQGQVVPYQSEDNILIVITVKISPQFESEQIFLPSGIVRLILDKDTSVVTFTAAAVTAAAAAAAAMFPNADDYLSNWVENPSQYN